MFAELLGKEVGYCKGKGGSMHIADPATGNLGANAIVGGGAALATGAAYASKVLGQDRVAVCFFGEGALGQGILYESMNLAQLWKLPVLYVCENNLYNEYTHYSETTAGDVPMRATAFGVPAETVDGQDVRAVYAVASRLVARALPFCWRTPTGSAATMSATSRVITIDPSRRSSAGCRSAIRWRSTPHGSLRKVWPRKRRSIVSRAK
jgi:TPP-dependent pyruvate/acetoin dehydrogenase alpha subunit